MCACASKSTSPESATCPASGRNSPAIANKTVVLPEPEGPNSKLSPGPKWSATSSLKPTSFSPRCRLSRALSPADDRISEAIPSLLRQIANADQHAHRQSGHNQGQARRIAVSTGQHGVVDRKRRGPSLTGNIARDHQRDPEVTERTRKAEHHAGQDPAPREWQADRKKCPQAAGAQHPRRADQAHVH